MKNEILCPICNSSNNRIIGEVNSFDSAKHFFLNRELDERFYLLKSEVEQIWKQENSKIVQCHECEFKYAWPFIAGSSNFYKLAYNTNSPYPDEKWEYELTLDSLSGKSDFSVLEIGAGKGSFLRKLLPSTSSEKMLATEFSESGKAEIESMGIRCLSLTLDEIDEKPSSGFDVVCMFVVLEHMDNWDKIFAKLDELTTNSSDFYLSLQNFYQREFYEKMGIILDMPPTHISCWNEKAMEAMLEKYKFQLIDFKLETKGFKHNLKQFLGYIYNYKYNSLVRNVRPRLVRKMLLALIYLIIVVTNPIRVVKLYTSKFGAHQWIHFRKK